MSEKKVKFISVSFGKLFLFFLLLFDFVIYYTSLQTSAKLIEENEKQIESYMSSELDSVINDTSVEGYVWKIFDRIKSTAKQYGIESDELSKVISECDTKYKTKAKFFFYKNKEFIKGFNYEEKDLFIFTDILKQLSYDKDEQRYIEANRKTHQILQGYFGSGSRLELINLVPGLLRRYFSNETKQFYHWEEKPDGFGIFFFSTEIPDFFERFKINFSEKANNNIGAIDSSNEKIVPPLNFTTEQTHSAYLKTIKSSKAFVDAYGYYWYFQTTIHSEKICYVIPTDSNINSFFNWAGLLEKLSLIFFFVILLIYITSLIKVVPGKNTIEFLDNLSIRYRIIGLLLISSFFPAVLSLIFGLSLLSDKEKVLEEAIFSESLAGISNIDDQYKVLKSNALKLSLDLREAAKHEKFTREKLEKYLDKYSIHHELAYFELRDEKVNTLFSLFDRETSGVADTIDLICRIVLKLHSPKRVDTTKLNISPGELVSESVLSTDELGFSTLLRQRGKQWTLRAGAHPTIWYWDVYPELATGPAFLCVTVQSATAFNRQVAEYFKHLQLSSDSMQLYAFISDNWYVPRLFPEDKNATLPVKELIDIAETAFKTNKVLFRTIVINGKHYWVTAKEEKNVRSHVFMHLISKEERLKVLDPYKWQLAISGIFTLLISILGAWFIISLVILPVNDLTKGIEAIRFRYKDFSIPVRRKDEFGELAVAFNHVLGELTDLEQGKIVQESLLPASAPIVDGYDFAFFTVSASDLAGDYHDYVTLEDGRVSVILGDVSGHGISASLAMAMAKATFNYAKSIKAKFPEEFMDMLNTIINKELKPRNKLMTLISMVLNPETGEVIFDNGGQSYPAYYSAATQSSEELKMPSLPLGGMKKRKKKPVIKNMEPGDAFIFYTDGIIEASSEKGEMFGYERFFAKFTEQMKLNISAKEAIANIYQTVEDFRESGHHSDDITLIIVKRK